MKRIISTKRSEILHVIFKDAKEFKDINLNYKEYIFDYNNKELTFIKKANLDVIETMELFACVYKKIKSLNVKECTIDVNDFKDEDFYAITNGLILTSYEYGKYTYRDEDNFNIILLDNKERDLNYNEYYSLGTNINYAKDLSNTPPNMLYPQTFVDKAKDLFKDTNVEIEVFEEDKIKELNMGGLYNVGKGSYNKPKFLIIKHNINKEQPIVLVGKGVTFDTGGYSIKTGAGMMTMKCDMGGAASVLAILKTLVDNNINKNIIGLFPLCENRVDDKAMLPGDVITMHDGSTVEVLNTDAEGRLILADAISYAKRALNAKHIIDMATLTGAAANAFGTTITPFVTCNDLLEKEIIKAKEITGEKFQRIQYYKEHEKMLDSTVANLKNIGGRTCGIHTSSAFLKHFAPDVSWMHLDIAGTHYNDTPIQDFHQKGALCGAIATVYYMIKNI